MNSTLEKLREKLMEALRAVMPVVGIVMLLCFTIAPISASILLCFLMGAALIVVGIMFFTLGAEMSMTPMGERVGSTMAKTKNLPILLVLAFILGFIITISEPDLQVLAEQVPSVPNFTLIMAVAVGVGLFLVVAMLRMLFGIPLPHLLVGLYIVVFIVSFFVPGDFLAVAFDSGGVTTGPMTATFLLPLAQGACVAVGGNIVTATAGLRLMELPTEDSVEDSTSENVED